MQCQSGVAAYWLEFGIVGAPVIQDLRAAVFTGVLPMPCWCRLCCTTLGSFRVVEMSYSSRPSHDETVNERLVADSDDEFAHLIRSIGLKHRCEMMWCCRRRGM